MDAKEFLTVPQAVEQSGVSDSTIRTALDRGRLPYTVLFERKLIKPADLSAWLASRKMGRPRKGEPDAGLGASASTSSTRVVDADSLKTTTLE